MLTQLLRVSHANKYFSKYSLVRVIPESVWGNFKTRLNTFSGRWRLLGRIGDSLRLGARDRRDRRFAPTRRLPADASVVDQRRLEIRETGRNVVDDDADESLDGAEELSAVAGVVVSHLRQSPQWRIFKFKQPENFFAWNLCCKLMFLFWTFNCSHSSFWVQGY